MSNIKHYIISANGTTINFNIKGNIKVTTKLKENNVVDVDIEPEGEIINIAEQPTYISNQYGYYNGANVSTSFGLVKNKDKSYKSYKSSKDDYDKDYEREIRVRDRFYRANAL